MTGDDAETDVLLMLRAFLVIFVLAVVATRLLCEMSERRRQAAYKKALERGDMTHAYRLMGFIDEAGS